MIKINKKRRNGGVEIEKKEENEKKGDEKKGRSVVCGVVVTSLESSRGCCAVD